MYSLGVVLIEISEWRPLKHIIKKHLDVTKPGVQVSLNEFAGIRNWLVQNQISNAHVGFRMGEIFEKGVSLLLNGPVGQEQGEDDAFGRFVLELSKCHV